LEIKKIQFFRLWFSLSAQELTNFGEYLNLKSFNRKVELREIYVRLVGQTSTNLRNLTRENLYQLLFPKRSFDDQHLRNTCFNLQQLLQKFLVIENVSHYEILNITSDNLPY